VLEMEEQAACVAVGGEPDVQVLQEDDGYPD